MIGPVKYGVRFRVQGSRFRVKVPEIRTSEIRKLGASLNISITFLATSQFVADRTWGTSIKL